MGIKVENIEFSYGDRKVLKSIHFTVNEGELLSVLGPNGAGKSTLFRCMLGTITPSVGKTIIDGIEIGELSSAQLARKIAYIPQSHNPVFNFSVEDMVLMGTTAQKGLFSSPGRREEQIARDAMERLGILHLKKRGYGNISGGERQMVLIARAIAQQAKILIMDEPSANLDFGNRIRLMQTLKSLTKDGYAVVQSTHDPEQAIWYSDRVLALREGEILAWGRPEETMDSKLLSELYQIDIEEVERFVKRKEGEMK